jgi:hypothetical protein
LFGIEQIRLGRFDFTLEHVNLAGLAAVGNESHVRFASIQGS